MFIASSPIRNSPLLAVVLAATLVGSIGFASTSAASEIASSHLQKQVSYGDLNLNHDSGVTVLYRRIAVAAKDVCRESGRTDLYHREQFNNCVSASIAEAVKSIDHPRLTERWLEKIGDSVDIKTAQR